mmetsp:Transcript_25607/g.42279  ORF Transcript_25607/g.42279 Transcript_25607/m.42279 type:complete len:659 (+) Transcript_25607:150-2126(+)
MGSTYSTDTTDASGSSSLKNNDDVHNGNGFTPQEAKYLSNLCDLLRRETQQKSSEYSCLASVWKYSHLLALDELTSLSSPNDVPNNIEAHFMQQYPQQMELIIKRCQQLDIIVSSSSETLRAASRLSNALQHIICNNDGGGNNHFLEFVSNMIWRHGRGCNQHHTLDFIWNVCTLNNDATVSAASELSSEDVISFCCQTAALLHYMLQNEDAFNLQLMELYEPRDIPSETSIIKAVTSSLNEYVTKTREHEHNFAGYGVTNNNVASSGNDGVEGFITKREFSEWQRKIVADLLHCSVVRIFEVLFFPPELPPTHLNNLPQNTKNSVFRKYSRPFPILESANEFTSKTAKKAGDWTVISSPVFGTNAKSEGTSGNANDSSSSVTALLSLPIFAFTSISTTKFGGKWHRLYAGADGWTFQKLEHAIMGYDGPTLLVIKASSKQHDTVTLGAYTAAKWERNKRDFFGVPDCFLFQLVPTLRVLKSLPKMGTRGGHYMYFHSNTNTQNLNPSKKDELVEGLGFGGTVRTPRLFVDCNLEECRASSKDTSFEEGHLGVTPSDDPFSSAFSPSGGASTTSSLHIESLEVFAVGDSETIMKGFQAQNHYRDIADSTLRNARTVDKAAFLGDMRNGVIETKAFAHRGQVDGRAHGCLKVDGKANGI